MKAFHVREEWSMFVAATTASQARHYAAVAFCDCPPGEAYRHLHVWRAPECDDLAAEMTEPGELDWHVCAGRLGWRLDEDGFPITEVEGD